MLDGAAGPNGDDEPDGGANWPEEEGEEEKEEQLYPHLEAILADIERRIKKEEVDETIVKRINIKLCSWLIKLQLYAKGDESQELSTIRDECIESIEKILGPESDDIRNKVKLIISDNVNLSDAIVESLQASIG